MSLGPGLSVPLSNWVGWQERSAKTNLDYITKRYSTLKNLLYIGSFFLIFFKEYIGIFVLVAYSSGIPREFVPRDMFPIPVVTPATLFSDLPLSSPSGGK